MNIEPTFYQDAGATVTNSRFMTSGQTHALSGITSVTELVEHPTRKGPVICVAVGLLALVGHVWLLAIGLVAIGVLLWMMQRPSYIVMIRTAAGEHKALTDIDSKRVSLIVGALNDAIVHRG